MILLRKNVRFYVYAAKEMTRSIWKGMQSLSIENPFALPVLQNQECGRNMQAVIREFASFFQKSIGISIGDYILDNKNIMD